MGLMGSYHDYIPDSVVEAYYGWDVDERQHCGTCDHSLEDHAEDGKCLRDDEQCECTTFNWEEPCRCLEPDPDEAWERMRDERND